MRRSTVLPGAISLVAAFGLPAQAQSVADFYKGKQIEFIVAAEPGSIYNTWARMLARHMP